MAKLDVWPTESTTRPLVVAKLVYEALKSFGDLDDKQAIHVANRIFNEAQAFFRRT